MAVGQAGKQPPRAGIIIQARMDSARLPGKVLIPVGNSNLLAILVQRLQAARLPVILATSIKPSNDALEASAEELNILCYRGSEDNVLERYYEAAKAHGLTVIVRVTGDNPFIEGEMIRHYVDEYIALQKENLFMSTPLGKTFPVGISFEIFTMSMLEWAYREAKSDKETEHVTPFFYSNPDLFDICPLNYETDKSQYRLTMDTEEDFHLIKLLIEKYDAAQLRCEEIIRLLDQDPQLMELNAHVQQKKWFE